MKSVLEQRRFPFAANSLKRGSFTLRTLIIAGMLFLSLAFAACSTIRLQMNRFTQKKNVLPHDMSFADEDYNIKKESACVITVDDDSSGFFMGKNQIAGEQVTERIVGKLENQTKDKQIVYIESAAGVSYGTIVDLLHLIEKAKIQQVGLVVVRTEKERVGVNPAMLAVHLFSESDGRNTPPAKPNPLTLIVTIDKAGVLFLNNTKTGSVSDTSNLTEKLIQVFKEREQNGIFREGTNEIEKTVFIKAPRILSYGDFVKVVNAVKGGGAAPINLLIGNLND